MSILNPPKEATVPAFTNLKTTLDGLHALNHLRGDHGSFQDALHHDAQMAHYFRGVLQTIKDGTTDPHIAATKALGMIIGQGEPIVLPDGRVVHSNAD